MISLYFFRALPKFSFEVWELVVEVTPDFTEHVTTRT